MNDPLVSVCVVTYNHVNYIKPCLDGILMQQTTFPFEIILGEDESDDGTREICLDYANKHPDLIKLFLRSRKDVIYINGQATGRYNFIENLKACRGKYIALCEGDDYWTDPLKLQKQVDFLEKNLEYILCFHKVKLLTKDGNLVNDFITNVPKTHESIFDLAQYGNYIHTPSVIFKNNIKSFPSEFADTPFGDYFLYLMLAQFGKIKYLEEDLAVYRYQTGLISKLNNTRMLKASVKSYSCMISYFNSEDLKKLFIKRQQGVTQHYLNLIDDNYRRKYWFCYYSGKVVTLLKLIFKNPKLLIKKSKNFFKSLS